jgi:hypothetical protein
VRRTREILYICAEIIDDEIRSSFAFDATTGRKEAEKDVGTVIGGEFFFLFRELQRSIDGCFFQAGKPSPLCKNCCEINHLYLFFFSCWC